MAVQSMGGGASKFNRHIENEERKICYVTLTELQFFVKLSVNKDGS